MPDDPRLKKLLAAVRGTPIEGGNAWIGFCPILNSQSESLVIQRDGHASGGFVFRCVLHSCPDREIKRALIAKGVPLGCLRLADGLHDATAVMARFAAGDFSDRVPTGLHRVDLRLRGGMQRGALYLLGAPSGGGKTTVVQQIAAHAARERGPVLLVSPEMTVAELAEREIIRRSGRRLADRGVDAPASLRDYTAAAHEQATDQIEQDDLPIYVLDRPDATMLDVEEEAARIPGLSLIVIDYAQQVADMTSDKPRYLLVGEVGTRGIVLAQRLAVPVLVASQVNVSTEKNERKYTFRETAMLDHKAHAVLIFDVQWTQPDEHGHVLVDEAHMLCRKNRSGAQFRLPLKYDPALYRVSEFAGAAPLTQSHEDVSTPPESAEPAMLPFGDDE